MTASGRVKPSVLSLFCGAAGGWDLGLSRAGYRTVAACEIDPWRRAVFAANNPGTVMYDDVRTLTADRLRADLGYLPDIVVGSPPCQEISAANSKGTGITDDHLFWDWARLVFEIRPIWCAAENSPRARSEGIDGVLAALEQAGYACWPCVVGANHAGANHERSRLWLIAADAERIDDPHPDSHGKHGRPGDGEMARRVDGASGHAGIKPQLPERHRGASSDTTRASLQGLVHDAGSCLPDALRDIGLSWPHWNGGIAGLAASCAAAGARGIHDGLPAGLAPGTRNRCIAAYGDAVAPQITEAIGRALRAVGGCL